MKRKQQRGIGEMLIIEALAVAGILGAIWWVWHTYEKRGEELEAAKTQITALKAQTAELNRTIETRDNQIVFEKQINIVLTANLANRQTEMEKVAATIKKLTLSLPTPIPASSEPAKTQDEIDRAKLRMTLILKAYCPLATQSTPVCGDAK